MSGQEREALEKAYGEVPWETPEGMPLFEAGFRAALTAREEAATEQVYEALQAALDFIETVEQWKGNDPDEIHELLILIGKALAAREEPPGGIEQKLRDALADALLWLERIPPPEEEIRALGRGLWDETLENARALVAAREDTERPEEER